MTKPDTFITVSELSAEFHVGKPFVIDALSGLTPAYSRSAGRGMMHLYDRAQACDAVRAAIVVRDAEVLAIAARNAAQQAPQQPIVQQVDLTPVLDQLSTLAAAVAALTRDVQTLRADTLGRLDVISLKDELNQIIVGDHDDGPAVIGGTVKQAEVAPAAKKIRVVVIAAPTDMGQRVKKQFETEIDFKFLESKDAINRNLTAWIGDARYVIGMLDWMNHGPANIDKGAPFTYIPLKGGQSKLLDKLTEIYVTETETT